MKKVLGFALIGAGVAAAVQPFTPTGWWLNSGRGVAVTAIVLASLSLAIGVLTLRWPLRADDAAAAGALWVGANIGLAIVLFRAGPGTIFPVVLAIGAGISAFAVAAGSVAGALLAAASRHRAG